MSVQVPIRQAHATILERITHEPLGEPISVTLGMDEEWSPRIQGSIVIPDTLDLSASWIPGQLWKLQGDTLTLALATTYGPGTDCAALTATYGGSASAVTSTRGGSVEKISRAHTRPWHPRELLQPLEAASSRWGGDVSDVTVEVGGRVAALTAALRQPGGSYLIPPSDTLTVMTRIRRRVPSQLDGTITLEIASEDVRLHDYRLTAPTLLMSTHTRLRKLVTEVLGIISRDAGDVHTIALAAGADVTITPGQEWKLGQAAWDLLNPILEAVGWTLYADHTGTYQLEARASTPATVALDAELNLIDFEPTTDLADAYYEGAVVEYSDGNPLVPAQRFDIFTMPGAQRIMHETRPGIRTIPGAAEQLVNRSWTRGTVAQAQATVTLGLRPGQRVPIRRPGQFDSHGTIRSISHTYPAAETTVALREVI